MKNRSLQVLCACSLLSLWSHGNVAAEGVQPPSEAFEVLSMHIEIDLPQDRARLRGRNIHSLMDLPAEVALEAETRTGLSHLELFDPHGRSTMVIESPNSATFSLSELSYEGAALTLRELLREFTPGTYYVLGRTIDGARVTGRTQLDLEFPGPFVVVSPAPMQAVHKDGVLIEWTPSSKAKEYRLEVESDTAGFSFEQSLPASRTSMRLPSGFFASGEEYEYSLTVEGDTDNELEVEGVFVTLP